MQRGRCSLAFFVAVAAVWLAGLGCAQTKVIEISTIPSDATIKIDGKDRGRGPITETFTFAGDTVAHTVQAEREGYRQNRVLIPPDFDQERLVITLKPAARRVTFSVSPMPAVVKLNGKPLSTTPVQEITTDVEFRIEPSGAWTTHTVTAEREGFDEVTIPLNYDDREAIYRLDLRAKRKDVQITTSPAGAKVFLNDKLLGESPVGPINVQFPIDPETDTFVPQKLRIEKAGYQTKEEQLGWEDGKLSYEYTLRPQQKLVRIFTDPPDAAVTVGNVDVKRNAATGAHEILLAFGPDETGQFRSYKGVASKSKTADGEWEPTPFPVAWDDGQTDYQVKLKEILIRKVPMLRVEITRGAAAAWVVSGKQATTTAMKDVTEGPSANKPVKVTRVIKGTMVDGLALSPDGSQILFTTLSNGSGELRSQVLTQPTDGTTDTQLLSDGRSLEIMPSYTPDGSRVVFASNRGGRKLSIWSMSVTERPAVPEQLTLGVDNSDLWPSVDSNPKPRMYYESRIDTRSDPRVFSRPMDGRLSRDLTGGMPTGGMQPRVSPAADAVLFCAYNEKTGKRDIFRMSNQGRDVTNLTNTPEVDEFDAAWSSDGLRIAYASDQGKTAEAPDNHDIWVATATGGDPPVRVTTNGSWDDAPAWDPGGRSIYFRSNRGGDWNVWRIELK